MIRMSSQKETKGNFKIVFMKVKIFAENVLVLSNFEAMILLQFGQFTKASTKTTTQKITTWNVPLENHPSENFNPRKILQGQFSEQLVKNSININME